MTTAAQKMNAPKLLPIGPVAGLSLDAALDHLRAGGRLFVGGIAQAGVAVTVLDAKTLAKFERAGAWLLKAVDDGGYRLRRGKGSVYLFPGQLRAE